MKKLLKVTLFVLCIFISVLLNNVMAEESIMDADISSKEEYQDMVKQKYRETLGLEPIIEFERNYGQDVIDEINNNNYTIVESNNSITEIDASEIVTDNALNVELKEKNEVEQTNAVTEINSTTYTSTSSSSTIPQLYVEPIANPYNIYNSVNESVSYTTGALNFEQSILSIPGRNGLDLSIGIKYNSDEAVITNNEFDEDITAKNINFNNFAIGWSFNFTTIIKKRSGINASYGYNTQTKIRFSDGSSYKISGDADNLSEDKTLNVTDGPAKIASLIRKGDTKEYILTYIDGTVEYFDGTYGNITKKIDKFGNQITFEYEDIDYFRGSFEDYIGSPDVYVAKLHLLKSIITTNGEIIDIEYTLNKTPTGNAVSDIKFLHNSTIYATINLRRQRSINGEVDVLSSYTDAEGYTTNFEYDEQISHMYNRNVHNSTEPMYDVCGSVFNLIKVVFPAGGISVYEYSREKRTYKYDDYYYGQMADWYEVYKVSFVKLASGREYYYEYEGDISGYPHTQSDDDNYLGTKENYYVNVIDLYNEVGRLYSFNPDDQLFAENVYDYYGFTGYQKDYGDTKYKVSISSNLFSVNINTNCVYVYRFGNVYTEQVRVEGAYQVSENAKICDVKTSNSKIYIFMSENTDKYVLVYDVSTSLWVKDESVEFAAGDKIYYHNNVFFSYDYSVSGDTITHYFYKPSLSASMRWSEITVAATQTNTRNTDLICVYDDKIYYKNARKIYEYDISTNSITYKTFSEIPIDDEITGFELDGKTYVKMSSAIYEFDYSTGTIVNIYNYPDEISMNAVYKAPDAVLGFYKPDENGSMWEIYFFEPSEETPWRLSTYRMINNDNPFKLFFDTSRVFMTMGYSSDYSQGFESIGYEGYSQNLLEMTEYTYNDNDQIISEKKTLFQYGKPKKEISAKYATYVDDADVLLTSTDELGNVTAYEYVDSTYYIPTKITAYSDTENALITENTLSDDKTKIISTITHYADRDVKTVYTYDSVYGGNVIREVKSVIKNGVETVLSDLVYTYGNNNTYIASITVKDVVTNTNTFTTSLPFDISISAQYDDFGRITCYTDAIGRTTFHTYDNNGRLLSTTYPDNTVVENEYDISGDLHRLETIYNGGYRKINYYTDSGQLVYEKERGSTGNEKLIKEYIYDFGFLTESRDYLGSDYYGYDHNYRNIDVSRFNDNYNIIASTSTYYDDYNQSTRVYQGTKNRKEYFDDAGRKIKEEEQTSAGLKTSTYEYDYMGNVIKTTDANGNIVEYAYNDMGQLISITDELERVTSYEYDLWGNLIKTTRNGIVIQQNVYDNIGRLIMTTDAANASEYFAYDNAGRLILSKDRKNQYTGYTYDDMDRVLEKYDEMLMITYTYDDNGNVETMTNEAGTTTYSYYFDNNLHTITTPDNKTITYVYDELDNVTAITDYAGNEYEYTYDDAGRLDTISLDDDVLADYTYDSSGSITKVTYPEGYTEYTYDNAFRLLSIANKKDDNSVINGYTYTYDLVGNQLTKDDIRYNSGTFDITYYTYDAAGRLISETCDNTGYLTYAYDLNDNLIRKRYEVSTDLAPVIEYNGTQYLEADKENIYSYNNLNQLIRETEINKLYGFESWGIEETLNIVKNYSYDANGNMTSVQSTGDVTGTQTYTYNYRNQLVEYTDSSNNTTTYTYDGNGMRISKTKGNVNTQYYWDRGYVSNEATGANVTATNHIGAQGIFARTIGTTAHYLFKNGHGDVENIYPQETGATSSYTYDAYGNIYRYSPTYNDNIPITYTGEYLDEESGLIYLRNRYYNPSIGRFITEDPIKDGFNWYAYCSGNPVTFVDPTGLDAIFILDSDAVYDLGHASLVVQDEFGDWYYFYWGQGEAVYEYIYPDEIESLQTLNDVLNKSFMNEAQYDGTYDYFVYIYGDFSDSFEYYKYIVELAGTVGNNNPNMLYSLWDNNCTQTVTDALMLGKLPNNKDFSKYLKDNSVIPNFQFYNVADAAIKSGYGYWGSR